MEESPARWAAGAAVPAPAVRRRENLRSASFRDYAMAEPAGARYLNTGQPCQRPGFALLEGNREEAVVLRLRYSPVTSRDVPRAHGRQPPGGPVDEGSASEVRAPFFASSRAKSRDPGSFSLDRLPPIALQLRRILRNRGYFLGSRPECFT